MRVNVRNHSLKELGARWERYAEEHPGLRSRETAAVLGCSEAALVATGRGSRRVRRLEPGRTGMWLPLAAAEGRWMWLVRNDWAVLEKDVKELAWKGGELCFGDAATEVGLDPATVGKGLVLLTEPERGLPVSVQIFNACGEAVLKLYLRDHGAREAVLAKLEPFALEVEDAFRTCAEGTLGTKGGHPVRENETRIAGSLHRELIQFGCEEPLPLTLTVENSGARMRVTVKPKNLKPMETWFNILDRGFNLHLREAGLASTRVSRGVGGVLARIESGTGAEVLRMELPSAAWKVIEEAKAGRSPSGARGRS
ncbi:MAG: ChuX/HutX family heme-like substrate-binding protein [Oceanipulchritudo sp.]